MSPRRPSSELVVYAIVALLALITIAVLVYKVKNTG